MNFDAQGFAGIRFVEQDEVDAEVFRLGGTSGRPLNVGTSAQTANRRRRCRACLGNHREGICQKRELSVSRDRDSSLAARL